MNTTTIIMKIMMSAGIASGCVTSWGVMLAGLTGVAEIVSYFLGGSSYFAALVVVS